MSSDADVMQCAAELWRDYSTVSEVDVQVVAGLQCRSNSTVTVKGQNTGGIRLQCVSLVSHTVRQTDNLCKITQKLV